MSLFNRPAWAKKQTASSDADQAPDDIFSHSNRSYREIVAEQERKKQAKAAKEKKKLQVKEERKDSAKRRSNDKAAATESSPKRRRISLDDEDDSEKDSTPEKTLQENGAEEDILNDDEEELYENSDTEIRGPIRRTPQKSRYGVKDATTKWEQDITAEVVELRDSDSDDDGGVKIAPQAQPKAVELIDDESDDEFAELARRARQQRQKESVAKNASHLPDSAAHSPSPRKGTLDTGHDQLPTPPPDPTIQLFISSRIDKTNPMIVYRKLSQNLADVRRVWCERQRFSDRQAAEVYFVHRMRRVYDVTTCRSLGIEVDSLGNLMLKGAEGKENVDKVHLEAVTDEVFQQMKAERAKDTRTGDSDPDADAGAENDQAPQGRQQPSDSLIRLVLKARGRDDFKLKVKANTTFSRIVAAYTKTQQLGDKCSVRLEFDGDPLNPDDEVQSTEITDLDCIDVHLN